MSDVVTIYTDGGARGNPGPAAFAYVITRAGARDVEANGYLGKTTNNIAEYTALVRALEHAQKLDGKRLVIHSDSELMIKQMRGEYKVKNEGLRPLYEEAQELSGAFESVQFRHVPREQNRRADKLCNDALDRAQKVSSNAGTKTRPIVTTRHDAVRAEAIDCLRAVAAVWARGDPNDPKPEVVWEQLWAILEDGGVLKK
jgi:ribonuclease HI